MNLTDRDWKEFKIYDIFNHQRGKRQVESSRKKGNIPYFSASKENNGLTDFISNPAFIINTNAIIYSTFGDAYFVEKKFSTSDEITILQNSRLNKYNGLFISKCINQNKTKYSFGRKAFSNKINKDKIMLPVMKEKKNFPDWDFMENYIKEKLKEKKDKYERYKKKALKGLEYKEVDSLAAKSWNEFFIEDLFDVKSGVRLTKENMQEGKIPFIGSVDSNNGITNFVSNINNSLDSNVLGVNYNGSVCEAFYHSYECIFSDDVKHLSLKNCKGNKFIYLFFKTIIYKQKVKFTYGYKFNGNRMKRQLIMVPVNKQGKPDYDYMEQYIKNIMMKKYN